VEERRTLELESRNLIIYVSKFPKPAAPGLEGKRWAVGRDSISKKGKNIPAERKKKLL